MPITRRCPPTDLFAGIDNLWLDKRKFSPSQDDIEKLCRFFCLGKLQHYEKEKNIIVSHSNFFVFAATTHGRYAFKFYPPDAAKTVAIEYAIHRILIKHHFLTPVMYTGKNGQPFSLSNNHLAACYSYMNGLPAWRVIKQQDTPSKINAAMLSLKNILSAARGRVPSLKQASLSTTIHALAQESRIMAPYDQKKIIDTSLREACQTYQHHRRLFTRQWLHNNANLTNFLIHKENVYTLDLIHIREDHTLADLASLVISCLFFDVPAKTIKTIIKDYFTQHKIEAPYLAVLNTLVKIGLIGEYLKNLRREKSIEFSVYPQDLVRTYMSHLRKRKEFIAAALKSKSQTA